MKWPGLIKRGRTCATPVNTPEFYMQENTFDAKGETDRREIACHQAARREAPPGWSDKGELRKIIASVPGEDGAGSEEYSLEDGKLRFVFRH